MRVKHSPRAEADIEDIHVDLSLRLGTRKADLYLSGMQAVMEAVADDPLMARERTEVRPPVRLVPFGDHHIFYEVLGDDVVIVRVLHHSFDWMAGS